MALDLTGLSQEEQFKKASEFAGVPESVLRGMWKVESSEGKNMRSPAGARGHFGLMPATQATWEERTGRKFNPDDFGDSITMAAMTMQENMKHFDGNISDALRGYNNGWDRERWDNEETQAYAGKVLGQNYDTAAYDVRNRGRKAPTPMTVEQAWNTSAYDVRNRQDKLTSGAASKEHLSDIEKAVRDESGSAAAVAAMVAGNDPQQAALGVRVQDTKEGVNRFNKAAEGIPDLTFDNEASWNATMENEKAAQARQAKAEEIGFGDKFSAAFDNNTLTAALWHVFEANDGFRGSSVRVAPDPNWSAFDKKNLDDIFAYAQNDDEVEQQMQAKSQGELAIMRRQIERERANSEVVATGSSQWGQTGYNLLAGVADPVGWAAGLGVGKAFQLGGVGARAAFAAGRTGRGFALAAAEGATGNVLAAKMLDAAGQYQTTNDYAFAAGTGLLFGAAFGSFDWMGSKQAQAQQTMQNIGTQIRDAAVDADHQLYTEAVGILGPTADPAQINAMVRALELNRQNRVMTAVLGSADDIEQILPRVDPEAYAQFRGQFQGQQTSLPKNIPGALLADAAARDRVINQYGLHLTIADDAERMLAAEQYARAERFIAENPVDKERAKTLLAAAGVESTASRMLMSDNPLMQFAASVLLESSSGAQGGSRRVTASMTAKVRERAYVGNVLRQYESVYDNWRDSQGGSAMRDFIDNGRARKRFDTEVYAERDRRINGKNGGTDNKAVLHAADMLDEAFERMRKDQKFANTLGASRLADTPVRGFTPRSWAPGTLRGMDSKALGAFQREVERQFIQLSGYDQKFAKKFSREYTTIMRRRASGAYDIPANLHDDANADVVRDVLKAMGASDATMDDVLGRFGRGGAGHTKERIDLDLTAKYTDESGGDYSLLDYINTDNLSLLRNYARRVAGEVSLSKYGVMGEPGMKELRLAIEAGLDKSEASIKQLEAFDQIAAEFLGRPFGTNLGKWADNARILTSAIRLGGMGFTQMGEATNAIAALGVNHAIKAVTAMPRLLKEVRAMKDGGKSKGLLSSIELYTGDLGMDGYKMQGLYDVNDGFELYGKESLDRFSKAARLANHGVRVMSMHRAITAMQTRGMSEQIALKALRYIKAGGDDAALADMGFHPELIARLKPELNRIAKFDGDRVTYLDLTKAEDQQAANEFAQAVARGSAQIIQDTFVGETGKWAHNDFLKLLTQFRTFSLISVEKQWGRQLAVHGGAKMLGYMAGAMSIALPLHIARVYAKSAMMDDKKREEYLDRNLDPLVLGRASMNYISTLGLLPDMIDAPMAVAGYSPSPRGAGNSDFIGGAIVPAAGVVNDAALVLTSHDPHKAAKLVPGSSIPWLAWITNAMDSSNNN